MQNEIYRLPKEFIGQLQELYPTRFNQILETFLKKKESSFRINFLKTDLVSLRRQLIKEHVHHQELPYPKGAFLLKDDLRQFQKTSVYMQGWVYVQNVSSMIPVTILDPQNGEEILDLCAAPGTKTTQIFSLAPGVKVTAVEKSRVRYYKLLANLSYQGIRAMRPPREFESLDHHPKHRDDDEEENSGQAIPQNVPVADTAPEATVYLMDGIWARKKFPEEFDKILVDAPCSASGRFDVFNPRSFKYWSERKMHEMMHTQKKLLSSAFAALKEGGTLIYSTCTFSPQENEGVVDWLLEKFKNKLRVAPINVPIANAAEGEIRFGGVRFAGDVRLTRRIIPNNYLEAFYIAKLIKTSS
jgi:16S rRNA C967 or C1407 C5-methylase (RsmB/RsmF family)